MKLRIIQVESSEQLPRGIFLEEVRFLHKEYHHVFPWGKVIGSKLYNLDKTEQEIGFLSLEEITAVSYITRE